MSGSGVHWLVLPATRYSTADRTAAAGPQWAQLGGKVITWSSAGDGAARLSRHGAAPSHAAGLLLVTQVGRAFQDEHPEIAVVLDSGRHLVVESANQDLVRAKSTCWRVESLPANAVVVSRLPSDGSPSPVRSDPATLALLTRLSPDACASDLQWLVGLGTRHSLSQGFATAATWAADRFTSLGYATSRQSISVGSGTSENIIAERPGVASTQRGLVLITAHLDSINISGGPNAPAPGADDNGSGSAGLLELARVLASGSWQSDLRLILFGGEEEGLHGSTQYVAGLPAAERARIRAVLNMDMIGTRNSVQPGVLLEGAPISSQLINDLAGAAATYTSLRVETSLNPFASDHVPFLNAGIPAVLTIEGADSANGNIHGAQDVISRIDPVLMQAILRMNLAALASWLVPAPTVPRPSGSVVAWGPERLDVFMIGANSALYHKAWDGDAWKPGIEFEYLDGSLLTKDPI